MYAHESSVSIETTKSNLIADIRTQLNGGYGECGGEGDFFFPFIK